MIQYSVYTVDDVIWSHSSNDRYLLEEIYPVGSVVEVVGTRQIGIILGNLRMKKNKIVCRWEIDVLIGTQKVSKNPWSLFIRMLPKSSEKNEQASM